HDDLLAVDRFAFGQRFFFHATGNVFAFGFVKVEQSVDAAISAFAFAFFQRPRANERQRPMLKLELVELSKALGAPEIGWLTFLFELNLFAERIFQAALDQVDGEIRDVDPDPLST